MANNYQRYSQIRSAPRYKTMRSIIKILLVCLVAWVDLKPRALPYQFQPLPGHTKYIEDSIQPPPPFNPIKIIVTSKRLGPYIAGKTIQITDQAYLIQLNPDYRDRHHLTFYHELTHVKQMVRQHLRQENQIWYWHNQPVDWNQPYHQRPWELEAIKEANTFTQPHLIKSN